MKKYLPAFYVFLFILITSGMIVCIYGIFIEKQLIYFVAGIICYILQNIIISLIYNDKEIYKEKRKKNKNEK